MALQSFAEYTNIRRFSRKSEQNVRSGDSAVSGSLHRDFLHFTFLL
jgi:hypothetical protein